MSEQPAVRSANDVGSKALNRTVSAYYRSMGCTVETDENGLVNVITAGEQP